MLAATPPRRFLLPSAPLGLRLRPPLSCFLRLGPLRRLLLPRGRLAPRGLRRLVHHRRRARHRRWRRWVHRLHHAGASPAALGEVVWLEHRISSAGCPWAWLIAYPGNAATQVITRHGATRRILRRCRCGGGPGPITCGLRASRAAHAAGVERALQRPQAARVAACGRTRSWPRCTCGGLVA